MTSKDLFGVVVRTIGLYYIVTSIYGLVSLSALPEEMSRMSTHLISPSVVGLAMGIALFMIADPIVNLAYRKTLDERVEIEKDRLFAEAQRLRALEDDQ